MSDTEPIALGIGDETELDHWVRGVRFESVNGVIAGLDDRAHRGQYSDVIGGNLKLNSWTSKILLHSIDPTSYQPQRPSRVLYYQDEVREGSLNLVNPSIVSVSIDGATASMTSPDFGHPPFPFAENDHPETRHWHRYVVPPGTTAGSAPGRDPGTLSKRFNTRLEQIRALEDGWDGAGAESIDTNTLKVVRDIAFAVLDVAGEPFLAPAPDGSVLLQWSTRGGASVDVYVEDDGLWPTEAALATSDGDVFVAEIADVAALRRLLRSG